MADESLVKFIGFIRKIDRTYITFSSGVNWHRDPYLDEPNNIVAERVAVLKLPATSVALNKALSHVHDFLEFTVQNGQITDIRQLPDPAHIEQETTDVFPYTLDSTQKSLREKLRLIVTSVQQLSKETEMVQEATFYEKFGKDTNIPKEETKKLVERLIREGILYYPKPGYLKKTD